MPSVYSPRWIEPEEPITRKCDFAGCHGSGMHKAPKSRYSSDAKDYLWFCVDHVKKYNESWNYFSGMSDDEMAEFWDEAQTGHRPTWKRGEKPRYTRDTLNESVRRTFADYLAGNETNYQNQRIAPIDRAAQKALAVLNLTWPVTEKDIKAKYKELVKQFHPDVNQEQSAEDTFKRITEAYQQLKTAIKKLKDEG